MVANILPYCRLYEQHSEKRDKAKSILTSCEQRDVRVRQEIKNAKAQYKKITKNLEKEIEKMKEFETAPERCTKEIEEFKQKMKILEVSQLQIDIYHLCMYSEKENRS